jgi:hypothetical protein
MILDKAIASFVLKACVFEEDGVLFFENADGIFEVDYNSIKEAYDTEYSKRNKIKLLNEAKQYLADTDWMVTKVSEIKLQEELGYVPEGTTAELAEKYKDISIKRYEARELINNLSK